MSARVLVVAGGWSGHSPGRLARLVRDELAALGCDVAVERRMTAFDDPERVSAFDLVVPIWTNGRMTWQQSQHLRAAVEAGTGLGGLHGSGDGFRSATEYQFLLGGQFVAHPGDDGVEYPVEIAPVDHPITRGLPRFRVRSEQYYLHVDPSIEVLATTPAPAQDGSGTFPMPVAWVRRFGVGRVFYCSLGHAPDLLASGPARTLAVRGLLWAAGLDAALADG